MVGYGGLWWVMVGYGGYGGLWRVMEGYGAVVMPRHSCMCVGVYAFEGALKGE